VPLAKRNGKKKKKSMKAAHEWETQSPRAGNPKPNSKVGG
jgi:hypothetical protein